MPAVLNQSGNCCLYVKGPKDNSRYYVSEKDNTFRRKEITPEVAAILTPLNGFYFETDVLAILEDKTESYMEFGL
jgi:hypothetical protein